MTDNHQHHDPRVTKIFRSILHRLEQLIAAITLVVLVAYAGIMVYEMLTAPSHYADITHYLHGMLNIVVGLEFVRMLIDTTPASILEVLTVAITRHVILDSGSAVSNLISVSCIAGLFAIRRFLIRHEEIKEELV